MEHWNRKYKTSYKDREIGKKSKEQLGLSLRNKYADTNKHCETKTTILQLCLYLYV